MTIQKIQIKILILLLSLLVSGCNGTLPSEPSTTAAETTSIATSTTSEATADPNTSPAVLNPPGMLPVVDEPAVLRIAMAKQLIMPSYEYGTNDLTTWLQDRTNVEIEFVFYSGEQADEEMRLDLSTGEDIGDVIHHYFGLADLIEFSEDGVLMDLTGLIKDRGFNFLKMMDTYPASWESITFPDGGIYALPAAGVNGLDSGSYPMRQWIHTGILQQYNEAEGFPDGTIPESTDAYRTFLLWCRDNIEGSVGWAGVKDSLWSFHPTDFIMNAFTLQDENGYYQKDGIIHAAFAEDDYREGLKYLNGLMEDGLMDGGYATSSEYDISLLAERNNGQTVATVAKRFMYLTVDQTEDNVYSMMPPLEGPDGFRYAFYDQFRQGVYPSSVCIPVTSSDPDLAVAWYDSCCDLETHLRGLMGPPGLDWEIPPEGTIAKDGGPALYDGMAFPYSSYPPIHWLSNRPCLWWMTDISMSPPKTDDRGNPVYDAGIVWYEAARQCEQYVIPCDVPGFLFDSGIQRKTQTLQQNIDALFRAAVGDFILGKRDIEDDASWAGYLAELEQAGLPEYLSIMQDEFEDGWADAVPEVYTPWPQRTE